MNSDFVKARELVVGRTYLSRQYRELVFLGKFDEYAHDWKTYTSSKKEKKQFYFVDLKERDVDGGYVIVTFPAIRKRLKELVDGRCHIELGEMHDQLARMPMYSPIDLSRTVVEDVSLDYFVRFVKGKVAEDYYFKFVKVLSVNDEYYTLNNPSGVLYFQCEDISGYHRKEKNHYEGNLMDFDTIEELYDILSPCRKHYYLENGNRYTTLGIF